MPQKLFKEGNYSRKETIRRNTVNRFLFWKQILKWLLVTWPLPKKTLDLAEIIPKIQIITWIQDKLSSNSRQPIITKYYKILEIHMAVLILLKHTCLKDWVGASLKYDGSYFQFQFKKSFTAIIVQIYFLFKIFFSVISNRGVTLLSCEQCFTSIQHHWTKNSGRKKYLKKVSWYLFITLTL